MMQKNGILLVLLAALAWSTAGLFTRVVTTDIPTTLFWRSLLGGFCVLAIYLYIQHSQAETKQNHSRQNHIATLREAFHFSRGEVVIGVLSTCGMIFFISSFFYTTIANVSFVYGAMPLVTFILALIFLKTKVDLISILSCVLCVVGAAIIVGGAQNFTDKFGIFLAFSMTFFMASLTIAAKYFPSANAVKATYFSAFLGAAVTFPFSTFVGTLPLDYFYLFLYGFFNVGLGFGVYLLGVQKVTAIAAALIGLIEIPLAPVWAWLLFREDPGANAIIGGVIILLATIVYIVMQDRKQRVVVSG